MKEIEDEIEMLSEYHKGRHYLDESVIKTMEELNAIILSLIGIPAYNRMLKNLNGTQKKKLLKICIDNNVKDSVDFVLMCER